MFKYIKNHYDFWKYKKTVKPIFPTSSELSEKLNLLMKNGISSIEDKDSFLFILFHNGSQVLLWNREHYYAWLSTGYIDSYHWHNQMPDLKTLFNFKKLLK